jgi:hypothetical protein
MGHAREPPVMAAARVWRRRAGVAGEVEEKTRVCFVGLRGLLVCWWWVVVRL